MLYLRITSAITATVMTLLLLASCGQTDTPAVTDTAENDVTSVTESQTAVAELPSLDLNGFTLSMGKINQEDIAYSNVSFAVSEENGEVLNDAIHRRNVRMMEKYNFNLKEESFADPLNTLTQQVMAGDSEYDVFLISLNKMNTVSNADTLINFHDVRYIDLDGAWWDQDMIRDLDTNGKQYFMNGDVVFSVYDTLRVIMYCQNLADDLKLTGFYEMVRDGKWTNDQMLSMMATASADLNGNGTADYEDRYGVLFNSSSFAAHITAMNLKVVDSNGTIGIFDDKFATVYEYLLKFYPRDMSWDYNKDKYPGLTARQAIVTMFDNKQCLFFENGISAASQYMRDVNNVNFGFLPLPKLDEAQDNYYSFVSMGAPVLCIPVTNGGERLDNTGFVLEALCRDSHESCVKEYFETCFSRKYTHDEESYEMILLATNSRIYDLGLIYDYGKVLTTINSLVTARDEAFMSKLEAIRPAIVAAFQEDRG